MEITAHVRQSSHPNQGAEQAKTARHVVLDVPLTGRLNRDAGDAMCRPAVDFYDLGHEDLDTDATCKKCLERAARYGVRIIKATGAPSAIDATTADQPTEFVIYECTAHGSKGCALFPNETHPLRRITPAPAEDDEAQQTTEGTWRGEWIGEQQTYGLFTIEPTVEQGALFDSRAAAEPTETQPVAEQPEPTATAPRAPRNGVAIPGALADHLAAAEITDTDLADALDAGYRSRGRSLIIKPKTTDTLNTISKHADAILANPADHTRAERTAARIWIDRAGRARKHPAQ